MKRELLEESETAQALRILDLVVQERGGQPRLQQNQMAMAVSGALSGAENLVIQAGTGVGKSLGYLVPLFVHKARGGAVQLVSTSSLALQRQIMTQDGPLVQKIVRDELQIELSTGLLKGWSNYLCRYRLNGGYGEEDLLWQEAEHGRLGQQQVDKLREWAEHTSTGDRDDVDFLVGNPAWSQVSVSKRECLGQGCPFVDECFPAQAKEAAFSSDIVVTNHALLGIYANGNHEVLPDFDSLVIDEAHDLAVRVRSQGTQQLSTAMIRRAAKAARKQTGSLSVDIDRAADQLADAFEEGQTGLMRLRPESLSNAMRQLDQAVREVKKSLKNQSGSAKAAVDLQMARAHLDGLEENLDAWGEDPEKTITWISESQQGTRLLNMAPLNVAGLMANSLFSGHSTVITSATLALGGNFDQIRYQTGIEWAGKTCEYLDVGTSFDPQKQGILYVASHLPEPNRDGVSTQFYDELLRLVTAAGGGLLGLFSSMRGAELAAAELREKTDLRVLLQGEDNLATLVDQFREDEDSCLLGTLSLWQGVDVPGRACRLVTIDRIPFPRPDDPIGQAQSRAAQRDRRNPFLEVSLAPASLLMAQGSGRLLRSVNDRGVVAILDSRMSRRSYGGFIANSLQPFWRTEDPEIVVGALIRLSEER